MTDTSSTGSIAAVVLALLIMLHGTNSQANANETFTIQLDNADIRSLIQTVSEKTGKNFIVDPRVKANVTLISSQPVNSAELYQLFLSVLDVHGYATVPAGGFTKIVPMSVGVQSAVPVISEETAAAGKLVTQVIDIEHIPAQQLIDVLRPLVPAAASIHAEVNSNTVIITDRAPNIARLTEIIRRLDRKD